MTAPRPLDAEELDQVTGGFGIGNVGWTNMDLDDLLSFIDDSRNADPTEPPPNPVQEQLTAMAERDAWIGTAQQVLGELRDNRPADGTAAFGSITGPDGAPLSVTDWLAAQGMEVPDAGQDGLGDPAEFDAVIGALEGVIAAEIEANTMAAEALRLMTSRGAEADALLQHYLDKMKQTQGAAGG
ncbi:MULTISPECIES: hypothetical protein [Roseomonadaceae]|uniref:Uncharacterized protein n=1 Tax=Falsiroseomonas oleicola TaxID=2801474 RepID=A0ABS6HDU1_9PROT|nr:hypothetical protein [Roseomonas oleicola]MBU8546900.1 hypothetical protein [Roseomonas oleicola]